MSKLQHYLSLVVFTLGFIVGIQIPNYLDQYAKRVDARLREAGDHLHGYQLIADRNHGGSLDALLERHRQSIDETFRAEAPVIERLIVQKQLYQREQNALELGWFRAVGFLVLRGNRSLMRETWRQYSTGIPLNTQAVVAAFLCAALACVLLELMVWLLGLIFRPLFRRRRRDVADV